jgi:hypothetical protein
MRNIALHRVWEIRKAATSFLIFQKSSEFLEVYVLVLNNIPPRSMLKREYMCVNITPIFCRGSTFFIFWLTTCAAPKIEKK